MGMPETSPAPQPTSTAQRRMSVSSRPRRASPLLHEIQPPSRRLSTHQVLLLTPFGGPIPDAIGAESSAVRRESISSVSTRGSISIATSFRRDSYAMSVSPSSTGPTSAGMGREPSMGIPLPPPRSALAPPRVRHSFAASPTAPSPLSQPLATIASSSEHSSSGPSSTSPSREPSGNDDDEMELEVVAVSVGTVAMTRSNSLPVLTLRELEAMKAKDSQLGIARGGDWAWVSRDEDDDDAETPGLSDTASASTSSVSLSTTPPAFTFSDPFGAGHSTFRRTEETARFGSYRPVATAEGYHYTPSTQADRRNSDIPPPPQNASPRSKISESRRPSAPPLSSLQPTPRAMPVPSFLPESPRGTLLPPMRPGLTRYKTSPARSEGLGLDVVVRAGEEAGPSTRSGHSTVERRERRHARLRQGERMQGEFGERRGSWAPVDVVDGLEADSILSDSSGGRTEQYHRDSISSIATGSTRSRTSFALGRNSVTSSSASRRNVILVDSTRAMSLSEFGVSPSPGSGEGKRSRFDSYDSAFPASNSSPHSPHSLSSRPDVSLDENRFDTFPRRGSSAGAGAAGVLGQMGNGVMGLWRKKGLIAGAAPISAKRSSMPVWEGGGAAATTDPIDWYQRRGSWADGWRKD